MPNAIAFAVLCLWPVVAIVLYQRMRPLTATFITIVGGYLLLPVKVEFDPPLIPPLDQQTIPVITAAIACALIKNVRFRGLPDHGFERIAVIALVVIPVLTVLTNSEPFFNGAVAVPGIAPKDSISAMVGIYLTLLPFILGLTLVKNVEDMAWVGKMVVLAGLLYSPLVLYEVRMSPQLHSMLYGFFPHEFSQQVRLDGFRPVVFVGHGLLVAAFYAVVFMFALALNRSGVKLAPVPNMLVILYLAMVIILCKSVGAWLLSTMALLLIVVLPKMLSVMGIRTLAFTIISYPLLCILAIFPHAGIVELIASAFGEDRAQSLDFRFFHESHLLEHAREKLLFGWGEWGRNRFADSVTDGYWIIKLSSWGIFTYLGLFGLMLGAILRNLKMIKRMGADKGAYVLLGSAVFVTLLMMNQLPNSSMYSWLWFLIGCAAGPSFHLARQLARRPAMQTQAEQRTGVAPPDLASLASRR